MMDYALWWKRSIVQRINSAEKRLVSLDSQHEMIRAHIDFLDFLTREDKGMTEDGTAYETRNPRDYRVEFVTWYLQHRPEKRLRS